MFSKRMAGPNVSVGDASSGAAEKRGLASRKGGLRQSHPPADMKYAAFRGHRVLPYLLLLPSIAIVVLFVIYPSAQTVRLSLYRVSRFGREVWVGPSNFVRVLTEPQYRNSLFLSVTFLASVVLGGLAAALGIAVLANQKLRGIGIFQIFFIWTYAISPAIMATIWLLFMDPATGVFPYAIKAMTGVRVNWTESSVLAFAIIVLTAIWAMLGYNILFFLTGLQHVSRDLLEAAQSDGAGPWTTFWKIIFPLLSPITFFLVIMNSLYSLYWVFPLIDLMTQGGPGRSTSLLIYTLFIEGFRNGRTGIASALSILLFVAVAIIVLMQFKFAGRKVFYQ